MTTSSPVFAAGGRIRPLEIVRHPRARALRLSIDPRDASVRLTLPRRASLAQATAWAEGKRAWIEAELAKLPQPCPIEPGMRLKVGGQALVLDWSPQHPRKPVILGDALMIGGPRDGLDQRLLRWLRAHAITMLEHETRALACAHGITIGRVGVGDAQARWGSCAASGDIRYNWRLILAPDFVRRATVAHEVAHRLHMNHGPAFHAAAAQLLGSDPAPARRWLRAHGSALHWFGRTG